MADAGRWKPPEDESEEEELDETVYKHAKDAVIFAIEVSETMLEQASATKSDRKGQAGQNDSPVSAALKCAYSMMQQRIISNPNDMMGILLYGTALTKFQGDDDDDKKGFLRGNLSYPNCYLLVDLDIPAAEDVQSLRSLVENEEAFRKLMQPAAERVSMSNVLFCANQIFTTKAPNFASRRLFIITDDDNPQRDPASKSSAAVRSRDLYDLGVVLELFPISRPNHAFDRSKFYNDIIYNSTSLDPEAPAPVSGMAASVSVDGISLLDSLISAVNSKVVPRRAQFSSLPLELAPGMRISVKGYILYKRQEAKRSCYIWLGGEKAQIAQGSTTQVAADSARSVERAEIRKAFKFGGSQVTFTTEEASSLRYFGDPIIRVIGFKPSDLLPIWANTRPATFLYPTEEDYVGSTRVFSALQQKLLRDDLIGLAWFIARKNAVPVMAAIYAAAERMDEQGNQVSPPGLWLAPLPFVDDVRQNPETRLIRASDNLSDKMGRIVRNLMLPKERFDPARYPNPALQWHYRILQAIALEEDLPEIPEDKTIPKYRAIDKRVGDLALEWGQELQNLYMETNQGHESMLPERKRQANSAGRLDSKPSKIAKNVTHSTPSAVSDDQIHTAYLAGSLGRLSVADLKAWLQQNNMSVIGNKAALLTRVEEYWESK